MLNEMAATEVSVKALASFLMVSERRVQQLTKQGVCVKVDSGKYDFVRSAQGYMRFLQARSIGNAAMALHGPDAPDYHREKARKIKAEADLAEIAVAVKRGQLVDAKEAEREAESVMLQIRTRMLTVPDRVTPQVLGEVDERRIHAVVLNEIEEALTSLADAGAAGEAAEADAGDDDEDEDD